MRMRQDWMEWVRDGQLMIEELQPMLDIEFGIRSKQSCKLTRAADEMKSPKVFRVPSMSSSGKEQAQ